MKTSLIIGLGNQGIQDESAGLYLLHKLKKTFPKTLLNFIKLDNKLLNLSSLYKEEENILIITSGYLEKQPGEYDVFPINKISKYSNLIGISSSVLDNLYKGIPKIREAKIWVLAIQAQWNEWGDDLSPEISQTIKQIISIFWHILETLDFINEKTRLNRIS